MAAFNNNVYYCFVIAEFVFVHQADTLIPVLIRIAFIEIDPYFYLSDVIHVGKSCRCSPNTLCSIHFTARIQNRVSKQNSYVLVKHLQ